jgi:hypothetical protein
MDLSENIGPRIRVIRQQRVILAADLAALYGVSVRRLNEQVRRNLERFPADFAFQLTSEVAICDFKFAWRGAYLALGLHRTWSDSGSQCA